MKGRIHIGLATAIGFLLTAPIAFAQDATVGGYGGQAGVVQAEIGGGGGGGVAGAQAGGALGAEGQGQGALPFTGLDLGLLLLAGVLLVAVGLTLRRFAGNRA